MWGAKIVPLSSSLGDKTRQDIIHHFRGGEPVELTVGLQLVVQEVGHLTQKKSISAGSGSRFVFFLLGAGFLNAFCNVHLCVFSGRRLARCPCADVWGRTQIARDWGEETQTHDALETGDIKLL